MKKILFIFICIFFMFIPLININAETFNLYSNNVYLYNLEEDKVMYEKNADEKASIASLTKAISAAVMLDYIKEDIYNNKIDFSKVDFKFLKKHDLSISSYDQDKTYTYKDFLYSFIMESSADCGYALVYSITSDVNEFSILMNKKAKELGMNNSHFDNPVGLDSKNNYSTMKDMVTFMKNALKNDELKKIMSTFTYKASDNTNINHTIKGYTKTFKLDMPYLKGGKTGYNDEPGFALVSYANYNGSTYILATTNAPYSYNKPHHFLDAKKLYEYYFKNYEYQKLVSIDEEIYTLNSKYTNNKKISLKASNDVLYYLKNDYDKNKITIKEKKLDDKRFNYKKGDTVGLVSVYYDNKFVKDISVISLENSDFSFINFISYNKLIIIALFIYSIIILSTCIIVKKIKNNRK